MNEVREIKVRYHNEVNKIALRKFNSVELDILFYLCSELNDKKNEEINISFRDIKKITQYTKGNDERLYKDLLSFNDKLQLLRVNFENGEIGKRKYISFVLFPTYEVDEENKYLKISVNPKFAFLLNELSGNFTKFELSSAISLKSTYSKNLFRLLSQYKDTGRRFFEIEEFKTLMDIPISYKMSDIDRQVLKPCINELSEYFNNIHFEKIPGIKGSPVTHINFYFDPVQKYKLSKNIREEKEKNALEYMDLSVNSDIKNTVKVICGIDLSDADARNIYKCVPDNKKDDAVNVIKEVSIYSLSQDIDNFVPWFCKVISDFEKPKSSAKKKEKEKKTSFTDYNQRDYDFAELERKILGSDD